MVCMLHFTDFGILSETQPFNHITWERGSLVFDLYAPYAPYKYPISHTYAVHLGSGHEPIFPRLCASLGLVAQERDPP